MMLYINLKLNQAIANQKTLLEQGKFFNIHKESRGLFYLIPASPVTFRKYLDVV